MRVWFVVLLAVAFAATSSGQTCIKLVTSLCDEEKATAVTPLGQPGRPGKRGQRGPIGPPGPKGDRGDESGSEFRNFTQSLTDRMNRFEDVFSPAGFDLRLTPRKGSYDQARTMCEQMNGNLLHMTLLNNSQQHKHRGKIERLLSGLPQSGNTGYAWIGISDAATEDVWLFNDGQLFDEGLVYYEWDVGEPNGGRSQNYGTLRASNHRIHNYPNGGNLYGLCEIKMEFGEKYVQMETEFEELRNQLKELQIMVSSTFDIRLTPRKSTFDDAQAMCRNIGGSLLQMSLMNANEDRNKEKIERLLSGLPQSGNAGYAWIGISDAATEDVWLFNDGQLFDEGLVYYEWDSGEPNGGRSQNYGTLRASNHRIHNYPNGGNLYGLCEIKVFP